MDAALGDLRAAVARPGASEAQIRASVDRVVAAATATPDAAPVCIAAPKRSSAQARAADEMYTPAGAATLRVLRTGGRRDGDPRGVDIVTDLYNMSPDDTLHLQIDVDPAAPRFVEFMPALGGLDGTEVRTLAVRCRDINPALMADVEALMRRCRSLQTLTIRYTHFDSARYQSAPSGTLAFGQALRRVVDSAPRLERLCIVPDDATDVAHMAPFDAGLAAAVCAAAPNLVVVGGLVLTDEQPSAAMAQLFGENRDGPVVVHIAGASRPELVQRLLTHTGSASSAAALVVVNASRLLPPGAGQPRVAFALGGLALTNNQTQCALVQYWTGADHRELVGARWSTDVGQACHGQNFLVFTRPWMREALLEVHAATSATATSRGNEYVAAHILELINEAGADDDEAGADAGSMADALCGAAVHSGRDVRGFLGHMSSEGAALTTRTCAEIGAYACATAPGLCRDMAPSVAVATLAYACALRVCARVLPRLPRRSDTASAVLHFVSTLAGGTQPAQAAPLEHALLERMCLTGACWPATQAAMRAVEDREDVPVAACEGVTLYLEVAGGGTYRADESVYESSAVVGALAQRTRAGRGLPQDAPVVVRYQVSATVSEHAVRLLACEPGDEDYCTDAPKHTDTCEAALALALALDCSASSIDWLLQCMGAAVSRLLFEPYRVSPADPQQIPVLRSAQGAPPPLPLAWQESGNQSPMGDRSAHTVQRLRRLLHTPGQASAPAARSVLATTMPGAQWQPQPVAPLPAAAVAGDSASDDDDDNDGAAQSGRRQRRLVGSAVAAAPRAETDSLAEMMARLRAARTPHRDDDGDDVAAGAGAFLY